MEFRRSNMLIPALQYGNSSTSTPLSSTLSSSPLASITPGPLTSSSSCAPCFVFASEGGANILSKVIWYETPVPITLDTVSVILSEFKNTTITASATFYGDVQKLNGSQIPAESSLRYQFSHVAETNVGMELINYYASMGSFVLANGTDGTVGGGVTSFAYPTPYLGINGFILYTTLSNVSASEKCLVSSASEGVVQGAEVNVKGLGSTTIVLNSTYYSPIPGMALTGTDVPSILASFYENVGMDTSSFSAFLGSNMALTNSLPMLRSCFYQDYGFGPPAFKIPVSALTATTTTTTQINGSPSGTPALGNPVKPPTAPQTTPPEIVPVIVAVKSALPGILPPMIDQPKPSPPVPPNQPSPSPSPSQNQGAPSQESPELPAETQQPQSPLLTQDEISPNQIYPSPSALQNQAPPPNSKDAALAAPYAGSTIQPDQSAQHNIPGIGTIQPGDLPVTVDNAVYPLAPSATAIDSSGITIPLTTAADPSASSPRHQMLTLGGSVYTRDSSSDFVVGSQTLVPGSSSITVFGIPVSLAPGGSVAIIGSNTVQLNQASAPTVLPVFTLDGLTYTANAQSAFVIAGQTLNPGSSLTVSGTGLFYPATGNAIVVGTRTENFLSATITAPPAPVLTFAGKTYTADIASAFNIDGQTLTKGGIITIPGTPVAYASGGDDVTVGTSTEAIGSAIMNGFVGSPGVAGSSTTAFLGSAECWRRSPWGLAAAAAAVADIVSLALL